MTHSAHLSCCLVALVCWCSQPARAFDLMSVSYLNGPVARINPLTGSGVPIGVPGFATLNSLAANGAGTFYSASGSSLVTINPITGAGTQVATLNFGANAPDVRGLAISPAGVLYAANDGGLGSDLLYTVDTATGQATLVGSTGVAGIQALEFSGTGVLYGWEVGTFGPGMGLVTINPLTGAVTDVNPAIGGNSAQIQGLAFGPNGLLYGARDALYTIDLATGAIILVGSGGYSDVRGLAVVPEPSTAVLLVLGASMRLLRRRLCVCSHCRGQL
jgi:hypothetical protein